MKNQIAILNSLPNVILLGVGNGLTAVPISEEEAKTLAKEGQSFIGHQSFADILAQKLERGIEVNRERFSFVEQDQKVLCCLVNPPRRLPEGERWTEEEILAMSVKYYLVTAL